MRCRATVAGIVCGWMGGLAAADPVLPASQPSANTNCSGALCAGAIETATSPDGLAFERSGLLAGRAGSPDVIRLPNRELLAIFDAVAAADGMSSELRVAKSKDDGKTWSNSRSVVFESDSQRTVPAAHASFLALPGGWIRIYFAMPTQERSREGCAIASAVTRDGLHFRLDREARLIFPGATDAHPCAARINREVNLFVVGVVSQEGLNDRRAVRHLVSADGLQFEPAERINMSDLLTQIIPVDKGLMRALICRGDQVVSFLLEDGRRWREEEGVRIKGAGDAAMVQRGDGSFLMLYATKLKGTVTQPTYIEQTSHELASAVETTASSAVTPEAVNIPDRGSTGNPPDKTSKVAVATDGTKADGAASTDATAGVRLPGSQDAASWAPFAPPLDFQGLSPEAWNDGSFAPKASLIEPFDYIAWFEQLNAKDNVKYAYESLFQSRPLWKMEDMISGERAAIWGPWDPKQNPDWESSYQVMAPYIQQFEIASQVEGRFGDIQMPPSGRPHMMMEFLLPSLASHRNIFKSTLAAAWRAPNGTVPANIMRDALISGLRSASQVNGGLTLIEHLVANAEKNMLYEHARLALSKGVFTSAADIGSMLHSLESYDSKDIRNSNWIATEHASMMDCAQYMFQPKSPGGAPQFNVDRWQEMMKMSSGEGPQAPSPETLQQMQQTTSEQLQDAIDRVDVAFRQIKQQWDTGFPRVRPENIDQTASDANDHVTKSAPALSKLMPSFARAYEIEHRVEAGRRATQLIYRMHAYRSQSGQWPMTLDQIDPPGGPLRVDPFTGADFKYVLTPAGPRLYSLSNNGQDDGGVHSNHWGDKESMSKAGGSDDYVFWPPQ